jgi:hypothetical protein
MNKKSNRFAPEVRERAEAPAGSTFRDLAHTTLLAQGIEANFVCLGLLILVLCENLLVCPTVLQ